MGVRNSAVLGYGIIIDSSQFCFDKAIPLIKKYDLYAEDIDWNEATPDYVDDLFENLIYDCEYITCSDYYATQDSLWFVGYPFINRYSWEFSIDELVAVEHEQRLKVKEVIKDFTGLDEEPRFCVFTQLS